MYELTKSTRWFIVLVALALCPITTFAINFNPASVKGLAQAYGFILGQEYSLSRIETDFPEMATRVALARAQFGATFPDIKTKLETQLQSIMSEKQFQETASTLQTRTQEIFARQPITREIAANFFEQVKDRSKGEIESTVLEYLLAVKYADHPVDEFSDGFRQRYQTDGTGKSQGIKLKLQLPRSWLGKDGERPHIAQKWMSENGTGLNIIMLIIGDTKGNNPTKKEINELVRSGEVKSIAPEGSRFIDAGNFNLEKQTGYWMQVSMPIERAGMKMYQDILIYQLFFRGKGISIQCAAAGQADEITKVDDAFKRMKPLCQQVLNSLVLTQAY
ncbi:MAG: hypothetical protein NTY60_02135 [Proteobacteria bacterium]|nr:hypothetical protein [Pseudomonadota bacterium]